jgi:hypothetical protein
MSLRVADHYNGLAPPSSGANAGRAKGRSKRPFQAVWMNQPERSTMKTFSASQKPGLFAGEPLNVA